MLHEIPSQDYERMRFCAKCASDVARNSHGNRREVAVRGDWQGRQCKYPCMLKSFLSSLVERNRILYLTMIGIGNFAVFSVFVII